MEKENITDKINRLRTQWCHRRPDVPDLSGFPEDLREYFVLCSTRWS